MQEKLFSLSVCLIHMKGSGRVDDRTSEVMMMMTIKIDADDENGNGDDYDDDDDDD